MSSLKRKKLKTKKVERSTLKVAGKSRKQMRKELRQQKKINRSVYLKNRNELRTTRGYVNDNKTNHSELVDKTIQEGYKECTKEIKKRKLEELEHKKKNKKHKLLNEANLKEDREIKKLEKRLKLNKRKNKTIPKSFVTDGLDCILFILLLKFLCVIMYTL